MLGAKPGEVIVSDSTTVNLFKLAGALLASESRGPIVGDAGDFPTDRYVLDRASPPPSAASCGCSNPIPWRAPAGDVERAAPRQVALVCLSHVDYRSGALADTECVERPARAPVIWDLSHSAGVLTAQRHRPGGRLRPTST